METKWSGRIGASVASVMLTRNFGDLEMLLGVRRQTPLASRFPGVLSTPTMAVPEAVFGLIDRNFDQRMKGVGVATTSAEETFLVGANGYSVSPAAYVLEHLLARKVGLAQALVSGEFTGTASLVARARDRVVDGPGTGLEEWTQMVTYSLHIEKGADLLPQQSASYSRLVWATLPKVREAIARRSPLELEVGLDPFEVCVQGLCLRAAMDALDALDISHE